MRVACVQFEPRLGQVDRNLSRMSELCPDDADLVVYPEMATSGYVFPDRAALAKVSETPQGPSFQAMHALAKAKNGYIAYGFPEKVGDILYNSAAIVGPQGLKTVYRKVHLFAHEPTFFAAGETVWPVVELRGVKVGLMICFDWLFPEAMRHLALGGADLVAHPSNLVLPYCQQAMITRCLENRMFAATCNRIGTEGEGEAALTFTGQSQLTGPTGERLARAADTTVEVIAADIDVELARDKSIAPGIQLFDRRKPALYRRLCEDDHG